MIKNNPNAIEVKEIKDWNQGVMKVIVYKTP